MKISFVIFLAGMLVAAAAEARTCNKGKPCGNSCIAVTKTCRK
jgi:hypothetical protein